MNFPYRITPRAQADIEKILERSDEDFGSAARFRYATLILAAITDVAKDPCRVASRARPELGLDTRSWHLRLSRERARTATGIVDQPRHLIFYRVEAGVVIIEHVLHEKQDAQRYFAK